MRKKSEPSKIGKINLKKAKTAKKMQINFPNKSRFSKECVENYTYIFKFHLHFFKICFDSTSDKIIIDAFNFFRFLRKKLHFLRFKIFFFNYKEKFAKRNAII